MGTFGTQTIILPTGAAGVGPVALTPFEMHGDLAVLEVVMSAGGTGTLSITAEVATAAAGGAPFYGQVVSGDAPAVWTTTATNAAGTYRLAIPGLAAADGDFVRLTYTLTAAVGNITIYASAFANAADAGDVGMLAPVNAPWGVLLNTASQVAGAYPATLYYPAAGGQVFGTAEDLQFDVLATGTAVPHTARWRVEFQLVPGGAWHDGSLAGYDVRTGSDGFASCESASAVATRRLWHFDNTECYAWRAALDLVVGASGPVYAAWRKR